MPYILNVDLKNLVKSVIDNFRIESKKKNVEMELFFDVKPDKGLILYFKTDPEKVKYSFKIRF